MNKSPETVGANAGLALARFVPWPKDDSERSKFFTKVAAIAADAAYKTAFARWKATMKSRGALLVTATLGGPLAIGLGNSSPTEVGLTLHRVYGMPTIPGSAIKGACLRGIQGQEEAAKKLFGDANSGGYAVFHDAWYDPGSVGAKPFTRDTVTVHHPEYYRTEGKVFPTDFDDPNPISSIVTRPGAAFLFAIEIPGADADWLAFAEGMLRYTLTEIGVGGKTNAGYGWFADLVSDLPPVVLSLEDQMKAFLPKIEALTVQKLSDTTKLLSSAEGADLKRLVARGLVKRLTVLSKWDKNTVDKPWRKAIEEAML